MTSKQRFGRREALVGVGATALGAAAVGTGLARTVGSDAASAAPPAAAGTAPRAAKLPVAVAGDPVRALFGPLTEGSAISTHWRIETLHAVRAGAIPVVMSTVYGDRFAVEIFRDDPAGPPPIARAEGLALHLVNGGDGSSPTGELAGLGVMALGRTLEARRAEGAAIPRRLWTHPERIAHYPGGSFDVPV